MTIHHVARNGRGRRALALGLLLASCMACGPIGPFSGGRLSGEKGSWPTDWDRIASVQEIQLETAPSDPHSVNLWLVVVDREAVVATSLLMGTDVPEEREWVRNIEADPRVRVRIEGVVYSARLETVLDPSQRTRIFEAFRSKYPQLEESRGDAARYFRLVERPDSAAR